MELRSAVFFGLVTFVLFGEGCTTRAPASANACSAPEALTLEVANLTDYLLEVRGANIAPLNCEPSQLTSAKVVRRDGRADSARVLLPRTKARFVFRQTGTMHVDFEAFMRVGSGSAATAIGYMAREFSVPHPRGDKNWQDVSPSFLTNYAENSPVARPVSAPEPGGYANVKPPADPNALTMCSVETPRVHVSIGIRAGKLSGPGGTWGNPATGEYGSFGGDVGKPIPDGEWVTLAPVGDDVVSKQRMRVRVRGATFEVEGEPNTGTCETEGP